MQLHAQCWTIVQPFIQAFAEKWVLSGEVLSLVGLLQQRAHPLVGKDTSSEPA